MVLPRLNREAEMRGDEGGAKFRNELLHGVTVGPKTAGEITAQPVLGT